MCLSKKCPHPPVVSPPSEDTREHLFFKQARPWARVWYVYLLCPNLLLPPPSVTQMKKIFTGMSASSFLVTVYFIFLTSYNFAKLMVSRVVLGIQKSWAESTEFPWTLP